MHHIIDLNLRFTNHVIASAVLGNITRTQECNIEMLNVMNGPPYVPIRCLFLFRGNTEIFFSNCFPTLRNPSKMTLEKAATWP